ncbi:MAG: peptidase domain-containing ABC transporter, partial [Bacilli bacterium]|nr:peptidase domain-containing ABC transporter [Bacilli bacterium]
MSKMVVIKQHDLQDCGVCSLKSIIKYYGGDISLERLRLDTHTTKDGTNALNLVEAAKKYGFDSMGVKVDSLLNDSIKLPAIAHITTENGLEHYVVIYKITPQKVHIMDPARGKVVMTQVEFQKIWNNILLLFYPKRKIVFMSKENSLMQLFLNIFSKEKKLFVLIVVASFLLTIFTIAGTYYFKVALEVITSQADYRYLKVIIFVFASGIILKLLFTNLRTKLENVLNKNIDILLYRNFLSHLFSLPLEVITSRSPGEIMTRVNELNQIKSLFTDVILSCGLDVLLMIISMPILDHLSHPLFTVLLSSLVLYLLIGYITSKMIYKKAYRNIEKEAEFNSTLIDNINLMYSIKNLNQTEMSLRKLENFLSKYIKDSFDVTEFIRKSLNYKLWIYEVGLFLINTLGFILIYQSKLSIPTLITFNSLVVYFLDPIKNIIDVLPKYNYIKASFQKLDEFLSIVPEKMGKKESLSPPAITFKEVTFSYNNYDFPLNKTSFKIPKGAFALLKGPSGSGKSTICKILEKYNTDYKGSINLDKRNLRDYSIVTIRDNITYISQKENLFTGTIRENILMNENVSDSEFWQVCDICGIEEIIKKKPMRYDTIISNESNFISGGERQRIILARGLLRKTSIYLIDEALSEIDNETERQIIKKLQNFLKDKTCI